MIIRLKNADFSENNIGKIYLPNVNLNIGEGTNAPLLFTYSNATGAGEFLGVDYITKENPSPFSLVRKLHSPSSSGNLYAFLTADRTSIDFPTEPRNISMAIWINKTAWAAFQQDSYFTIRFQFWKDSWKGTAVDGGDNSPTTIKFGQLALDTEFDNSITTNDYFSGRCKRKVLDRKTVNGEDWVCVGIVFYNLVFDTSAYEANSKPRIGLQCPFINNSTDYAEMANFQVVMTDSYLDPTKEY